MPKRLAYRWLVFFGHTLFILRFPLLPRDTQSYTEGKTDSAERRKQWKGLLSEHQDTNGTCVTLAVGTAGPGLVNTSCVSVTALDRKLQQGQSISYSTRPENKLKGLTISLSSSRIRGSLVLSQSLRDLS